MVMGWLVLSLQLLGSYDAEAVGVGVGLLVVVVVVVETSGDHGERWNYCRIADADVVRSGRGGGGGVLAAAVLVFGMGVV